MHVKMDKDYSLIPDEYANVQIDEDVLESNTSEEVETKTEAPKKKPSLRILE